MSVAGLKNRGSAKEITSARAGVLKIVSPITKMPFARIVSSVGPLVKPVADAAGPEAAGPDADGADATGVPVAAGVPVHPASTTAASIAAIATNLCRLTSLLSFLDVGDQRISRPCRI